MYFSTKKFGPISTSHRQWKADNHCKFGHGYSRYAQITFGAKELDDKSWTWDFGNNKEIRKWLEEQWDHRLLLASNDPLLPEFLKLHDLGGVNVNVMDVDKGYGPGIELSCKFIYDYVDAYVKEQSNGRVWVKKVEIWEHEFNSAVYEV